MNGRTPDAVALQGIIPHPRNLGEKVTTAIGCSACRQCGDLTEADFKVAIEAVVDGIVAAVDVGLLAIRADLCRLLDGGFAGLFDGGPDVGSDAGQEGDAVGGAFGGVGEDDGEIVYVGLEVSP